MLQVFFMEKEPLIFMSVYITCIYIWCKVVIFFQFLILQWNNKQNQQQIQIYTHIIKIKYNEFTVQIIILPLMQFVYVFCEVRMCNN